MTDNGYEIGGVRFERGELFALGAAAGALVTAAISEYLDRRRRPATPWERAKAAGADALDAVSDSARANGGRAKEYVQDLLDAAPGAAKQTRTVLGKRRRQAGKEAARQADRLKEAAVGALGTVVVAGLADTLRDLAGEAQSRSATLKDQIVENYESLRDSAGDADLGTRAQQAGETAAETIRTVAHSAADTLRDYTKTARERLADADLPDRARDYSATVKDAVGTAREKLVDADLSDRAKTAATVAGATIAAYGAQAADATRRTAREGATKLGESATHLAQATSEQAADLRFGVQKGVKRTRRRARWGLRALLVGVAVGILAAPQSGSKTREALSSFVQNFLDVLMPDEQT